MEFSLRWLDRSERGKEKAPIELRFVQREILSAKRSLPLSAGEICASKYFTETLPAVLLERKRAEIVQLMQERNLKESKKESENR